MSKSIAPAFDRADALEPFASTRANYERFAFLLLRVGHVPGLALAHLDFRVVLFLLAQKPRAYAAHHRTIARACDSNTTSIRKSLGRLHSAGIVLWELIPPHHVLPTGRYTRTNVNRYWVHLPRLAALLEGPQQRPAISPNPHASTRPKSRASSGTENPFEQQLLPPTPREAPATQGNASDSSEVEAVQMTSELQPILRGWAKLGLGELDHRSIRALENRRTEGATVEQLEAAVAGAAADDWLRRRAVVPFAVVFASLASVERFAHQGRKVLHARTLERRREAEERGEYRERRERTAVIRNGPLPSLQQLRAKPFVLHCPPRPPRPMTSEELARHRAEEIARLKAWSHENGVKS
jgi:hypothetical protein